MIKRLVFDLDNTLFKWEDKYIDALKETLKKLNINCSAEDIDRIDYYITDYENNTIILDKREFVDYLISKTDVILPYSFADILIEEQGNCYPENSKSIYELLEYLKSKYDLVLLSNWFTRTQKLRLKNSGLYDFFTVISGGDERYLKPDYRSYEYACKPFRPSECIMIGDNYSIDIEKAVKFGMRGILLGKSKIDSDKIITIEKIYDLKDIL